MTIFTQIIHGSIPSYKIYEDDKTYAFLDINQFHKGKILIVPKIEVDHFFDLDDAHYQAMFSVAKLIAPVIKRVFDSKRIGLVVEGLEVPHVHVKVFPINQGGDIGDNEELKLSNEEMLGIQNSILKELSM